MLIKIQNQFAFVFLALALLMAACSAPAPTPQAKLQPVKLKVGTSVALTFAPFYIADAAGYFTEQALEVEFVQFATTREATAAIEQGQLDVLGGNASPAYFNSVGRGARLKLVADKGYVAPTGCTEYALLARKSLVDSKALDDPAKIRGLKGSVNTVDISGYLADKALATKGLTLDDIQAGTALLAEPVIIDGFAKGTLDLAVVNEPSVTRILEAGNAAIWFQAQALMPNFARGLVIYGPNLLDKNPDVGRRFMVAYLKGVKQFNEGKTDRNLDLLSKVTQLDREFLKRACWAPMRTDGKITTAPLFDFQAWAVKRKLVDSPVPDEKTLYDPAFVEYANKVLGTPVQ